MWHTLSICLLSLVISVECVKEGYHFEALLDSEDQAKERRNDKMEP